MEKKLSKEEQKELVKEYMECQSEYAKTKDIEAYQRMFCIMLDMTSNALKKMLKGVRRTDIDELSTDACISIMNRYFKGEYHVKYPLTVARNAVVSVLYSKKQKFQDKLLSYDAIIENGYEPKEEI